MKSNVEKIDMIMQLYYEKQRENEELAKDYQAKVEKLNTDLLNIRKERKNKRDSLNKKLDDLNAQKEAEIKDIINAYKLQISDSNLKTNIEKKYDSCIWELKVKLEELNAQNRDLKEKLKNTALTSEEREKLNLEKKQLNASIKSINTELAGLNLSKERELDSIIPEVATTIFETLSTTIVEPKYKKMHDDIVEELKKLDDSESEIISEESELKLKINLIPNYSEVYLKEMVNLKDELRKVLYQVKKGIFDMINLIKQERQEIISDIQKVVIEQQSYEEQLVKIQQKINEIITNQDANKDMSQFIRLTDELKQTFEQIARLKSINVEDMQNGIKYYDNQIKDLESDLKLVDDDFKIIDYTKEESEACLKGICRNPFDIAEFNRRNYNQQINKKIQDLKNKLFNDGITNMQSSISAEAQPETQISTVVEAQPETQISTVVEAQPEIQPSFADTQEFEKLSKSSPFIDLSSSNLNKYRTQEFDKTQIGSMSSDDNSSELATDFIIEEVDIKEALKDVFTVEKPCVEEVVDNKSKGKKEDSSLKASRSRFMDMILKLTDMDEVEEENLDDDKKSLGLDDVLEDELTKIYLPTKPKTKTKMKKYPLNGVKN